MSLFDDFLNAQVQTADGPRPYTQYFRFTDSDKPAYSFTVPGEVVNDDEVCHRLNRIRLTVMETEARSGWEPDEWKWLLGIGTVRQLQAYAEVAFMPVYLGHRVQIVTPPAFPDHTARLVPTVPIRFTQP